MAKGLLFFVVAAVLVATATRSEVKVAAIVITSFAYMRVARTPTVQHALFVGTAWLALAIATEMIATATSGHGWFSLCGTPSSPMTRDVMLCAWLAAPALFAREHVIKKPLRIAE